MEGIDSRTKVINVDGIDVKLQLWDTVCEIYF